MRTQQEQERPNVIVFFTDQQRWDTTGIHGNPLGLTPNFDRFARYGTDVHYSFTCQPVCGPARSCLQTGCYATQTGVYRNGLSLRRDDVTLAKELKRAGYSTGYIGKWHLNSGDFGAVPTEDRAGYDSWLAANCLEFTSLPYDTVLYNEQNESVKLPGYRVDALTDAAIRFIDQRQHERFFLFVSHLEPHHQNQWDNYPAPRGYESDYRGAWVPPDLAAMEGSASQHLAGYCGMVKRLDEAFGRLLDSLISLGIEDKTIVLFSSDHGCHFKTRNAEYKRSPHDSSLRVPTALSGPGFVGGGRFNGLVSIVDLAPTILDACGLEVPVTMQGRSFMQFIRCPHESSPGEEPWPREVFFQTSEEEVGRGLRTRRWKYSVVAPTAEPFADDHAEEYVEKYLYDLQSDPYELSNLISLPSHKGVREILRARLKEYIYRVEGRDASILPVKSVASAGSDNPQLWGAGQRQVFAGDIE